MANVINKGTLFPAELAKEVFSKVKGESALANLVGSEPIPFNGKDIFTFSMDGEVSIVGESAEKPAGGAAVAPVQIRPLKVVYQNRVSEEFLNASEESQLNMLEAYADGFHKKIAKALDLMAINGVNPATGTASSAIGTNCFASAATVVSHAGDADADLDAAITAVDGANGVILSATYRNEMAALKGAGKQPAYPEFKFGACPSTLGDCKLEKGKNLTGDILALVGDFDCFKWGFAKEMPLEVIEYGDPDGLGDLKRNNQICLRTEAYIGWGILDASAFRQVKTANEDDGE